MAKGLCCAAQSRGDLGKPLVMTIHTKSGAHQRCGVCEVVPSCRNQAVKVFAFRFLPNAVCNLAGKASCKPTPAGEAQYLRDVAIMAPGGAREPYAYQITGGDGLPLAFTPRALPGPEVPYILPR